MGYLGLWGRVVDAGLCPDGVNKISDEIAVSGEHPFQIPSNDITIEQKLWIGR